MNMGRLTLLLAGLLLAGATEVFAQTQVPAPEAEPVAAEPAAEEMPVTLDEVTVTAQKREEDLQDVPIAITAFSAAQIEEARIQTIEEAFALVPNVSIAHSFTVGNSFVTVRGLSQVNNSDSPIAVVVDGVYQGTQKQLVQELFDLERIEILKGPQGALYGRNSLGGVLNIITRQPTERTEGSVRAGAGNGSAFSLAAALGGKLHDALQFRFAASYKDSDGLIENTFLDERVDPYEDFSGRLQLKWLPRQNLQLDFRTALSDTEGGAVFYSLVPTAGFDNDFRFAPDENILGFSRRKTKDFTLRAVWDTAPGSLTSITGVSDLTETYRADADFSNPTRNVPFPFGQLGGGQDFDIQLASQEIRWASHDDQRLRWLAGVYVQETDRALTSQAFFDTNGTIAGFVPFLLLQEDNDNTAQAAFGEIKYDLADRWILAGALRFDTDRRRQTDLRTGNRRSKTFSAWQPNVSVSCQATDAVLAYLSLGTGFRSGGFNAPTVVPEVFKKETSENLEAGVKSTLWQGRLRLNGAAYLTEVSNEQYFQLDLARGGQIVDNIRDARMRGLELDLTARLARPWDAYAAIGINDSEIRDFDGSARYVGNQTPSNTRWKASAGTQYAHPLGHELLGLIRFDGEFRGRQYWHPDNLDVQRPIQLLSASFAVEALSWKVTAWARNLTDERYYVEYLDAAWGGVSFAQSDIGQWGPPRSYGIEVQKSF